MDFWTVGSDIGVLTSLGDLESQSIDIRQNAFQQIRNVIKTRPTRYTAQTAFRAIEERIARAFLGTSISTTIDGDSDSDSDLGDDAEVAVQ